MEGTNQGAGEWRLSDESGCWRVDLVFPDLFTGCGLVEHKVKSEPRYYLQFVLGDPDSGNEMILVKQK